MIYSYFPSFIRDTKKAPGEILAGLADVIENVKLANIRGYTQPKKIKRSQKRL